MIKPINVLDTFHWKEIYIVHFLPLTVLSLSESGVTVHNKNVSEKCLGYTFLYMYSHNHIRWRHGVRYETYTEYSHEWASVDA